MTIGLVEHPETFSRRTARLKATIRFHLEAVSRAFANDEWENVLAASRDVQDATLILQSHLGSRTRSDRQGDSERPTLTVERIA